MKLGEWRIGGKIGGFLIFGSYLILGLVPINRDAQETSKIDRLARDLTFPKVRHGLESETLSAFGFPIY